MIPARSNSWKWMVCGLLLLASAINYMDRQTLANAAVRITKEFSLRQVQYGNVEAVFGYAFAAGSLVFGWMADRYSVRWLYAAVLALWSIAGFITGFVKTYDQLMLCRFLLGFFEAGHWPCAIRTTRLLLDERQRSMGNSLLQSGASFGAIITPFIMQSLMTADISTWRLPFQVVGAVGLLWIIPWLIAMRGVGPPVAPPRADDRPAGAAPGDDGFYKILRSKQIWIVFFVIACINTTWQILRAWMPKFLQEGRGYTEAQALGYNAAWFAATDVGCLAAGALAVWLARKWCTVHAARLWVFIGCALLCTLCAFIPRMPAGAVLLITLAIVGAGALGLFPLYHAFTQDISGAHQGKITGLAGVAGWLIPAQFQKLFGLLADKTGSFDLGLVLAGFLPLLAAVLLALFWRGATDPTSKTP
jgi:ACS family hexuronate transporter-like MFS transporter